MGWVAGRLNDVAISTILQALGVDALPPSTLADDDPRLHEASAIYGTLGLRVHEIISDYDLDAELDRDHGRLEKDVIDLRKGLVAIRQAASRIRGRSRGARDHLEMGLVPTERDESEETLAAWFDKEWDEGDEPASLAFQRLCSLAASLEHRSVALVAISSGRKRTRKSVARLICRAADVFEEHTGKRASAPKASSESTRNTRGTGSERNSPFLSFMDVLFAAAEIEPVRSQTVRNALNARKKAPKLTA